MQKSRHTYEMGVIGNCAYMAHINKQGEIVWLCWPRFDSSFIFGKLIGGEQAGFFAIEPEDNNARYWQEYIENTNILITHVDCEDGEYAIFDFAPRFYQYDRYYKPLMLVRKIKLIRGRPKIRIRCHPVDDYGNLKPRILMGSNHLRYAGLSEQIRLTTELPLNYIKEEKFFHLTGTQYLFLTYGVPLEGPVRETGDMFFKRTLQYWRRFVRNANVPLIYQEEFIRSMLVLKLHQYEDTGAIIASATTSLPETPGSGRNWDYRYCWMRDAFYTLGALRSAGQGSEMEKYASYIENLEHRSKNKFAPVYSILGDGTLEERVLDLEGYMGNKPVRIGNQAAEHIQNDVYGQILVSLLPLYIDKRFAGTSKPVTMSYIQNILKMIEKKMDEPDAGLWEFRNFSQLHTYTYLFHWAGANSVMRIAVNRRWPKLYAYAEKIAKEAEKRIEQAYDADRGVYTEAIGSSHLDASLLQLVTMRYLDPMSEKAKKHVEVLARELGAKNGLFYRYKHTDDFGQPESTFFICAFWYVEALAEIGEIEKATENLEQLIRYGNHLGLFSEDVDENTLSQWGNFPQTYSHVGLMNAVKKIADKLRKPEFLEYR
ncbi:MAG: glycoside hydrolase family 15 protein [Candidatus Hydrogenedentota bacterium]|nr:MAG: glycoside hydrolase family 15 protein [Candidatus Hydrogenedentota bacterium]